MPTPFRLSSALLFFLIAGSFAQSLRAEEPPRFMFDTGATEWRGERISLPPTFAADMNWIGEEDIRFAPGMFSADAEDFFTYVLVFILDSGADISEQTIEAELLTYYRGLSTAVMKGKQKQVDTEAFKVELSGHRHFPSGRRRRSHSLQRFDRVDRTLRHTAKPDAADRGTSLETR